MTHKFYNVCVGWYLFMQRYLRFLMLGGARDLSPRPSLPAGVLRDPEGKRETSHGGWMWMKILTTDIWSNPLVGWTQLCKWIDCSPTRWYYLAAQTHPTTALPGRGDVEDEPAADRVLPEKPALISWPNSGRGWATKPVQVGRREGRKMPSKNPPLPSRATQARDRLKLWRQGCRFRLVNFMLFDRLSISGLEIYCMIKEF